jgi:uncharacterized membrane protein YjjP (DUF1212 family)
MENVRTIFEERADEAFVIELAVALHGAGVSAHRLEEAVDAASRCLGLDGQVIAAPTSLMAQVGHKPVRLQRVGPGGVDLERMVELDELAQALGRGELSLDQALVQLRSMRARRPRWGRGTTVLAFGLTSMGAVPFFGGGWLDLPFGALLGLLTGGLIFTLGTNPHRVRVYPSLAALLVALGAGLAARTAPVSQQALLLSGLIALLPGFSLTMALTEISSGHLVSGSSRLMGALLALLQLAVGVALGLALAQRLQPTAQLGVDGPLPAWVTLVGVLLSAASFVVLFKARPRDMPAIAGVALLAILGTRFGVDLLGEQLGPALGALGVGLASNLYARSFRRPASVTLLPGMLLLVPGSLGLRAVQALADAQTLDGIHGAFSMFLVAASLVAGLLTANALLAPRRAL